MNCEENCLPRNETGINGMPFITTCCSYDLCSFHVSRALKSGLPDVVKTKRINSNYESTFSATSTAIIASNTSFSFSSITGTPVETITSSPSLPSSNTSSKFYNNYYNVLVNFLFSRFLDFNMYNYHYCNWEYSIYYC